MDQELSKERNVCDTTITSKSNTASKRQRATTPSHANSKEEEKRKWRKQLPFSPPSSSSSLSPPFSYDKSSDSLSKKAKGKGNVEAMWHGRGQEILRNSNKDKEHHLFLTYDGTFRVTDKCWPSSNNLTWLPDMAVRMSEYELFVTKFDGSDFAWWSLHMLDALTCLGQALPLQGKDARPHSMSDRTWEDLDALARLTIIMDGYKEEGSSSQDRQSNPIVHEVDEGSSQAEEGFPHAAFSITGTASPGTLFGGMQSMVLNPMYANIGLHPGFQGTQGQFGVSQGNLGMAGFSIPPVNMAPRHQHVSGQGVQMAPTGQSRKETDRGFWIADDMFWKDGEPFRILGGDVHYFRIHPKYWEDRLLRAKALGLNTIQTYVPWNLHEPRQGEFHFDGVADLESFLKLCQQLDLLVMLRAGPYICAEWDFGGFPAWLLAQQPPLRLRSSDSSYLKLVDEWWKILLPKICPLLYENGGPVIMVQVENEFGSFGKDNHYLQHLVNQAKLYLGNNAIMLVRVELNAA
ncbi:hypothetical protein L7F22_038438 [Adiantum nelumboides]|nr:hypothetical protein [Adiantum nelumboides]